MGWIVYWSLGNCTLTVKIIVGLIRKLNLTDSVFEALTPIGTKSEVETNTVLDTETLTAVTGTSAAGSGCPTDDIVSAAICIVAASAGVKTPSIREPRPRNTEDDMLE